MDLNYVEILKIDLNVRVCFMSAGEVNYEAVRELYPTISIGCFIKKTYCNRLFGKENKGRIILVMPLIRPEELIMMLCLVM